MSNARHIVGQLGGKWNGRSGTCRCPAHEDRDPSMSITETRDGRPLVYCHAGCSQMQLIDALRARGLWDGNAKVDPSYPGYLTRAHDGHTDRDERERQQYARDLWDRSNPISGTFAETYLRARGIASRLPDSLGYLANQRHAEDGGVWPCLLAPLRDLRGNVTAVQRTWLTKDGGGKAPVKPAKKTYGPMMKAAVQLWPAGEMLGLAEGVETALSAKQIYQIPVWATLSANRLGAIELPESVVSIVIFADHGRVGMDEAVRAAEVYERQGRAVDVMPPRVHFGEEPKDFNDAVRVHA